MVSEERLIELGALLRSRRRQLGLRRSDVARRVGVTHAYIARIEEAAPRPSGRRTRPSQDVVSRWAVALEMNAAARVQVLQLAGYAAYIGQDRLVERAAREDSGSYVADALPDHPLVLELRALLNRAEATGELAAVEGVLRPLFLLLRDRVQDQELQ